MIRADELPRPGVDAAKYPEVSRAVEGFLFSLTSAQRVNHDLRLLSPYPNVYFYVLPSQRKFEAVQSMHDPNFLASFAARAPYHADALLQLGMVFAHTGQASACAGHARKKQNNHETIRSRCCFWHASCNV